MILLLLLLAGCPSTLTDDDDSAPQDGPRAVLLYGAYTGDATLATSDWSGEDVDDAVLGLAGADWALSETGGDAWLLGRYGTDVVRRYPDLDFAAPAVEFSTGSPSNPQEVELCDGSLFVTRYGPLPDGEGGDVAIYDPDTGAYEGRIDLSDWDPSADGSPEPTSLVRDGDTLYVNLQRFDRDAGWTADPVGKVVAIDCTSRTVTDSWDTGPNPFLQAWPGDPFRLILSTDEGIEILVPGVPETTIATTNGEQGGELGPATALGDHILFLRTADADSTTTVRCLDTTDGSLVDGQNLPSWGTTIRMAPDGLAWVTWRDHWLTSEPDPHGFARYDPTTCETVGERLEMAAEPLGVVFVP